MLSPLVDHRATALFETDGAQYELDLILASKTSQALISQDQDDLFAHLDAQARQELGSFPSFSQESAAVWQQENQDQKQEQQTDCCCPPLPSSQPGPDDEVSTTTTPPSSHRDANDQADEHPALMLEDTEAQLVNTAPVSPVPTASIVSQETTSISSRTEAQVLETGYVHRSSQNQVVLTQEELNTFVQTCWWLPCDQLRQYTFATAQLLVQHRSITHYTAQQIANVLVQYVQQYQLHVLLQQQLMAAQATTRAASPIVHQVQTSAPVYQDSMSSQVAPSLQPQSALIPASTPHPQPQSLQHQPSGSGSINHVLNLRVTPCGKVTHNIRKFAQENSIEYDGEMAGVMLRKQSDRALCIKLKLANTEHLAALQQLARSRGVRMRIFVSIHELTCGHQNYHTAKANGQVPVFAELSKSMAAFEANGTISTAPINDIECPLFTLLDTASINPNLQTTLGCVLTPARTNSNMGFDLRSENVQLPIRKYAAVLHVQYGDCKMSVIAIADNFELFLFGHGDAENRHMIATPLASKEKLLESYLKLRTSSSRDNKVKQD